MSNISKIFKGIMGLVKRNKVYEVPDIILPKTELEKLVEKEIEIIDMSGIKVINKYAYYCKRGIHRMYNIGHGETQCRDCGYHTHICDRDCTNKPKYLRCKNPKNVILPVE